MDRAQSRAELWSVIRGWRRAGHGIGLVPTMGNLHQGHLALVDKAREIGGKVVASIYVNPTQFGEGEDFEHYPRTLESDLKKLDAAGCDLVFIPDLSTMYPFGLDKAVSVLAPPDIAARLEGASRPGHFDGVTTVVARLFNLVMPDYAVFGEKDYQQLLVIRRMVEDLSYAIEVIAVPTVREEGGLAMSSRNSYLEEKQRKAAGELNRALRVLADRIRQPAADFECAEQKAAELLEQRGLVVDYVAVRRAADLARPRPGDRELRALAAVWCGKTRLIDNVPIE
jgi:pantoate--beta-alanine ligase